MRIYTKTGDKGTTGLVGGGRVHKTDDRIEALGAIDELNACLGVALTVGPSAPLAPLLLRTQNQLFDLGAEVATPQESEWFAPSAQPEDILQLEKEMDGWTAELPPLKNFILPGGTPAAAQLHLARTICRRAERQLLRLAESHPLREETLIFVNRLSDWLFVLARQENHLAGVTDVKWLGRGER